MTELIERDGVQYVRNLMRESYQEKRVSFENFLKNEKNISLEDFTLNIFGDKCFDDTSIPKAEFIVQLLKDDISIEYWLYLRNKFMNLGYLTDRRNTEEYAFDIALGWLAEELIINEINTQARKKLPKGYNFETGFMGIDSEREYQSLSIRATADFYIIYDQRQNDDLYRDFEAETGKNAIYRNKETKNYKEWLRKTVYIKIDLFVDYKGTWAKNNYFDLKRGKIGHFQSKDLDWVLAFDIVNQNLYLVSRQDALGIELTPNPAMGNVLTANVPLTKTIELEDIFERIIGGY